ncbi:hypothetical protein FB567DRAFT_612762 [Paraphoma chrysanthemicola]|uniref:Uncharacterized protein n=1 Tax=Paraphoma chrysanthemicola TaxID=798071 RepID=A0A8K0QT33_9PLEO|nr:hypothetical protein FB567DRAFT_612762 [Paraphoma chrysanthemicola]
MVASKSLETPCRRRYNPPAPTIQPRRIATKLSMSAEQDLDDLHDALVSHFTEEYEKFLENAEGRERDLIRLKDAEKQEALAQLKREHADEMKRTIVDLQLQHRTTEAESFARIGRQKDEEREEVVKTLEQQHTEQAKQEAVQYAQMIREIRDEIITKCGKKMGKLLKETQEERDRKNAEDIADLRQQHEAKQAEAVAEIERKKDKEKEEALVQQKHKEKREAAKELKRKHTKDMEQVRINMENCLAEKRAKAVAQVVRKKDKQRKEAMEQLRREHAKDTKASDSLAQVKDAHELDLVANLD